MAAAARTATRRLLRELESWQAEREEELQAAKQARAAGGVGDGDENNNNDDDDDAAAAAAAAAVVVQDENSPNRGIERLGLAGADGDDLFRWVAVLNGQGVGGGYDDGRWLLEITVPPAYPNQPPTVRFATPILHANVHPATGAVCLDLLQAAWTPALTIAACVRAVRMLLGTPGTDSPLNIDLAALLRAGDTLAAARLVQLWCEEQRYGGI